MHHTSKAALLAIVTLCLALVACGDDTVYSEDDANAASTNNTTTNADTANNTTSQCDPGVDGGRCVCTDGETGATCDPNNDEEGTCTCALVSSNNPSPNNVSSNNSSNNTPANNGNAIAGWRFVLVEDLASPVAGEYPGSDIDAIELTDPNGSYFFATTVEDFQLGGGNALDPSRVLGAPDSNCDASSGNFLSLGGQIADGYIIVGFSSSSQDVTFSAGSTVTVHEIGGTMCGQFDDDPFAVSVSVSTNRATFTQIGTAIGMAPLPVTFNP